MKVFRTGLTTLSKYGIRELLKPMKSIKLKIKIDFRIEGYKRPQTITFSFCSSFWLELGSDKYTPATYASEESTLGGRVLKSLPHSSQARKIDENAQKIP